MRIGIQASYSGGFQETAAEIRDLESAGLDVAMVAEVYTFDAVSQLGYLAAVTERVELMSGIFPIYSRTPALTAMTAAGLDFVSDGRFTLGLGASGPQVIEGWHGVPYDAPLQRTREIVEICRQVWRRERLEHHGQEVHRPAAGRPGHRAGQAAEADQHPGARADPGHAGRAGPEERRAGRRDRRGLGADLLLPGEGGVGVGRVARRRQGQARPGARRAAGHRRRPGRDRRRRRGAARRSSGRRWPSTSAAWARAARTSTTTSPSATATRPRRRRSRTSTSTARRTRPRPRCPTSWCGPSSLIGPESYVAERIAAFAEAGVTTLMLQPLDGSREGRLKTVETMKRLGRLSARPCALRRPFRVTAARSTTSDGPGTIGDLINIGRDERGRAPQA